MSAPNRASLQRLLASRLLQLRIHEAAALALLATPLAVGMAGLAARALQAPMTWHVAFTLVLLVVVITSVIATRRHDVPSLLRRIDDRFPQTEDSSALALRNESPVNRLQALQQAIVRDRLVAALQAPSAFKQLRPAPPRRGVQLAGAWSIGLAMVAAAAWWPATPDTSQAAALPIKTDPAATALLETRLTVTAPVYTGLAVQRVSSLDAKVPAGSRVEWSLVLDHDAEAAALVWSDGSRTPLVAGSGPRTWHGERTVDASALYRIELSAAPKLADDPLRRIDVIPDAPPEVSVREPQKTLNLLGDGQTHWGLAFDARDDYGLGAATLTITLAQGSGEQIKVTGQTRVLDGGSDAHHRSYRETLDLPALGFAKGDDLIVRLDVADNHAPEAQHTASAGFILRWPVDAAAQSLGMEGLVQKVLPAYFRSERQIIIDTEALIDEQPKLHEKTLAARADALGIDQKVLRLRYGQFLGEGFESNAERAPPGLAQRAASSPKAAGAIDAREGADARVDADAVATADSTAEASLRNRPPEPEPSPNAAAPDGDRGGASVLAEFGHAHDQAEAATLLDPQTQRILRNALGAMWQAELKLRQGRLREALPFEAQALEAIKQIQQAERIYLARAGQELPQADAARRLSGERKGLRDREQALPGPEGSTSPVPSLWNALTHGERVEPPALKALSEWMRRPDSPVDRGAPAVADPLALQAAIDRVQRAPDCSECRDALQAALWPLLPAPATGVLPRAAPDAAGAAYLDALRGSAASSRRP